MPVSYYPPTSIANGGTGATTGNGALTNLGLLRSYLATTVTYNDNGTLADTPLSATLVAAGVYKIELVLFIIGVAETALVDFGGGTVTVTSFTGQWLSMDRAAGTIGNTLKVTARNTAFSDAASDITNGLEYTFIGTIVVNAAGTFILRGAQLAHVASDTQILLGSNMVLTKMN